MKTTQSNIIKNEKLIKKMKPIVSIDNEFKNKLNFQIQQKINEYNILNNENNKSISYNYISSFYSNLKSIYKYITGTIVFGLFAITFFNYNNIALINNDEVLNSFIESTITLSEQSESNNTYGLNGKSVMGTSSLDSLSIHTGIIQESNNESNSVNITNTKLEKSFGGNNELYIINELEPDINFIFEEIKNIDIINNNLHKTYYIKYKGIIDNANYVGYNEYNLLIQDIQNMILKKQKNKDDSYYKLIIIYKILQDKMNNIQ